MDLVEIVAERTGTSRERAKIYVEMAKQRALAHTKPHCIHHCNGFLCG